MKTTLWVILIVFSFLPVITGAQTNFKQATITLSNGQEQKEAVRFSKGKLFVSSTNNSSKEYRPDDVKNFIIDGDRYISYSNDFYKEVVTGSKAGLYQKVSDNSDEKMYNGPEVVGFLKTTEGKIGDYYVLLTTTTELNLVTKKNFKNYFTKLFTNHDDLVAKVQKGELGYDQIRESVQLYNTN